MQPLLRFLGGAVLFLINEKLQPFSDLSRSYWKNKKENKWTIKANVVT